MAYIVWTPELDTGIDVIDDQHKRIVEYINDLYTAHKSHDQQAIAAVLENVLDYTLSHFGFEEVMMEDAGYEFLHAHQRVHQVFIQRVTALADRFKAGEDVTAELHNLLARWLVNHIQKEDHHYAKAVKERMLGQMQDQKKKKGLLARFFRG